MTSHTAKTNNPGGINSTRWTKETIIAAVQEYYRRTGRSPTIKEMQPKYGLPWWGSARRRFGTHNAMLIAAGLPYRQATHVRERQPAFSIENTEEGRRLRVWEREEILKALRETYEKHGRMPPPHPTLPGFPSRHAIKRVFGSWSAALREAGITSGPPAHKKMNWGREEALEAMRAYRKAHGDLPKGPEKRKPVPYMPSRSVYIRLFGTWNNAVKAAGFEPKKQGGSKPGRVYRKTDRERPNPREFQGWRFDNRKGETSDLKEKERRRSTNAVQRMPQK